MTKNNLVQSLLATLAMTASISLIDTDASADSPNGPIENVTVTTIRVHNNGELYVALANAPNHCPSSSYANYYFAGNVNTDASARSFLSLAQAAYLSGRKVTIWTGACAGQYGTLQWMAAL